MTAQHSENTLQNALIQWYEANARNLPWRQTQDPYAIWVSEVMLQQTRVATVIPYYHRFLEKFPTLEKLSAAKEEDVLALWAGLGYYARVRNLHRGAKDVVARFGGKIPQTQEEIRTIPGIGAYTAGAILSIAYNKDEPILDGNVARVLSRVHALVGDPRSTKAQKTLWTHARNILIPQKAGTLNQALMELGARVCLPQNPTCLVCPIRSCCQGANAPETFGARDKKTESPTQEAAAVLLFLTETNNTTQPSCYVLAKRPPTGLLANLWELPSAIRKEPETLRQTAQRALTEGLGCTPESLSETPIAQITHVFTHLRLQLSLFQATTSTIPGGTYSEYALVTRNQNPSQPLPSLTVKALRALRTKSAL